MRGEGSMILQLHLNDYCSQYKEVFQKIKREAGGAQGAAGKKRSLTLWFVGERFELENFD